MNLNKFSFFHAFSAAACVAAAAMPERAGAQSPAYVGTWASRTEQCRMGQDSENAPLILKRGSYDQHEAHCKFVDVRVQGRTWTVNAKCTIEGNAQTLDLVLQTSGRRLTIRDKAGARTFKRCR